jgi:hypothetical protein
MKTFALGLLLSSSIVWAQVPQSMHIWILTEENHSYESVIGNPAMPYFNSQLYFRADVAGCRATDHHQ